MCFADAEFVGYYGSSAYQLLMFLRAHRKRRHRLYIRGQGRDINEGLVEELTGKNIVSTACFLSFEACFFLSGSTPTIQMLTYLDAGELFAGCLNFFIDAKDLVKTAVKIFPNLKVKQIASSYTSARALLLTDNELIRIGCKWNLEPETNVEKFQVLTIPNVSNSDIKQIVVGKGDKGFVLLFNSDLYATRKYQPDRTDLFELVARNVEKLFTGKIDVHYLSLDGKLFNIREEHSITASEIHLGDFAREAVGMLHDHIEMISRANMTINADIFTSGGVSDSLYTPYTELRNTVKVALGASDSLALGKNGKLYSYAAWGVQLRWPGSGKVINTYSDKHIVNIGVLGSRQFAIMVWE